MWTSVSPTLSAPAKGKQSPQPPGEWELRLGSFHRLVLLQALAPTGFAAAAAAFAAPFVGAERGDAQHQLLAAAAAEVRLLTSCTPRHATSQITPTTSFNNVNLFPAPPSNTF